MSNTAVKLTTTREVRQGSNEHNQTSNTCQQKVSAAFRSDDLLANHIFYKFSSIHLYSTDALGASTRKDGV